MTRIESEIRIIDKLIDEAPLKKNTRNEYACEYDECSWRFEEIINDCERFDAAYIVNPEHESLKGLAECMVDHAIEIYETVEKYNFDFPKSYDDKHIEMYSDIVKHFDLASFSQKRKDSRQARHSLFQLLKKENYSPEIL